MSTAAAAIIIRREKQIVEAFRDAGATTPDKAITMESIGMHRRLAFHKLRNRAVLREAAPEYFYLDEDRWVALTRLRRTMAAVSLVVMLIILIVGLLMTQRAGAQTRAHAQSAKPAARPPATKVILLGTGTPNADPDHSGPGVAIVVGNSTYLVDAGPGIVRRAAAGATRDTIPALDPSNLRIVFLTHLHSDHTVGLPDLMLSPWVLGRTAPLEVYGPPGTRDMVDNLAKAYAQDIDIRLHGGEPSNKTGWKSNAHEITAGAVYRDSVVTVTAFDVAHGKWPHAFAYRFVTADRTIVVSGDTRPTDAIVEACNKCDVLIHEVYSADMLKTRPADWRAYHKLYHTSTLELASIAKRAQPRLLVLYHQLYWGDTDAGLLRQIKSIYSGPVRSGRDLAVY